MRLLLAALLCLLSLAAEAQFIGGPQITLINTGRPPESVFDNNGSPWPFTNLVPAIAYDKGGQGLAYNVTPRSEPACNQNGAAYRGGADYVNFKTSTWTAQPTVPFQLCGSSTLPTGGDSHNYAINVSQAGPYTITVYNVNPNSGAAWRILIDGVLVQAMSLVGNGVGSFSTVTSTTSGTFNVGIGNHTLSLVGVAGDPTANYIGDLVGWQGAVAGGAPALAAAAGFNTPIVNIDFTSQPLGQGWINSNVYGCGPGDPTPATPSTWHFFFGDIFSSGNSSSASVLGCDSGHISIVNDGGLPALMIHSQPTEVSPNGGLNISFPAKFVGSNQNWLPSHLYVKVVFRVDHNTQYQGSAGFTGHVTNWVTSTCDAGCGSWIDENLFEQTGQTTFWPSLWEWSVPPGTCFNGAANCVIGPSISGLDITTYSTMESLVTSDGSTDTWECTMINGAPPSTSNSCFNFGVFSSTQNYTRRDRIANLVAISAYTPNGTFNPPPPFPFTAWIRSIQIWACAAYNSGSCLTSTMVKQWP